MANASASNLPEVVDSLSAPVRRGPPVLTALAVAEEMAREAHVSPHERDSLRLAAVTIERWLGQQARPGRWDLIDPGALVELAQIADPHAAAGFLLSVGGLIGHVAFHGDLDLAAAHRIFTDLRTLTSHPAVTTFASQTLIQFEIILRGDG